MSQIREDPDDWGVLVKRFDFDWLSIMAAILNSVAVTCAELVCPNAVLALRNDREPKFIRPFLSCKSAKIMVDRVTGIARGYGFVRYVDTFFLFMFILTQNF